MFEFFPTKQILAVAGTLGPERVQSLEFRFDNEDLLLLKGAERLWFGWGGFNRERVYDPDSAKDLVIQDGQWIAVFGTQGVIGFLCYFSLMVLPVFNAPRQMRRVKRRDDRTLLITFGFVVVICAVNMLPNMALPFLQFVFATGLATLMREVPRQEALERQQQEAAGADERANEAEGRSLRSPAR
jgi:hypothetical protein